MQRFLRTHLHNQEIVVTGHRHLRLKNYTLTGSYLLTGSVRHFVGRTDMAKSCVPLPFKQLGHLALVKYLPGESWLQALACVE